MCKSQREVPPIALEGELAPHLSRWLWLVKWFLAIPHYVALVFLWIAFSVLTVIAFFAVLFTGRYPRGIFGFNVGVLRWSWRVASTPSVPSAPTSTRRSRSGRTRVPGTARDRLPAEPAPRPPPHRLVAARHPAVLYRGHPRRGADGAPGSSASSSSSPASCCCSRIATRPDIFDLVLGLNRWVLRVVAYAAFMTREYPPFRLDAGPHEPSFEMKQAETA